MALPSADCPAAVPGDLCCDTTALMAARIRTVAFQAITECNDPACNDREFRSYVSHGPRIQEPLGDALVVHRRDLRPSLGSNNARGRLLRVGVHEAEFRVVLFENGWPMLEVHDETQEIVVPDSDLVDAVAQHSMAHSERVYRDLIDGIQRKTLFPESTNPHIGEIVASGMSEMQPTSFIAPWEMTVTVEVTLGNR